MNYIKVDQDNLYTALTVQHLLSPKNSAYQEFKNCLADGKEYNNYFLVYDDHQRVVGLTGLYTESDVRQHHSLFLGRFGVLPEFRTLECCQTILRDTAAMAKDFSDSHDIKYFRAFISTIDCPQMADLFDRSFDLKEYYINTSDYTYRNSCAVYTQALGNFPVEKWNNRFLNIKKLLADEAIGNEMPELYQ